MSEAKSLKQLQDDKHELQSSLDEVQLKLMIIKEEEVALELKKQRLCTAKYSIERKMAQINRQLGELNLLINPKESHDE